MVPRRYTLPPDKRKDLAPAKKSGGAVAEKTCTKCGNPKAPGEFYRDNSRPSGLTCWCKACVAAYYEQNQVVRRAWMQAHWKANRDKVLRRKREIRARDRAKVFDYYGRVCVCCGEDDFDVLTLDHLDGDGAQHRKAIGIVRSDSAIIYRWIIRNNFPDKPRFTVLCKSCNSSKGRGLACRKHDKMLAA